jgi:3-deoxy-D-manno-octulosonic-acid transferase
MGNSNLALRIFWVLYNGMLLAGFVIFAPLLVYTVATTAKRRHTFRQRMGWCGSPWSGRTGGSTGKCIWVHALSVGEVLAAQPMVSRLRQARPDLRICFTTSTFTGFQTAQQVFGQQQQIGLAYFPYDWIGAVRRIAAQINPSLVVLTETDIWPNFLMEMHRRRVPVNLINLRFSEGTWRNYRRFGWLARTLLGGFEKIAVQQRTDMKRLVSLGLDPEKIAITGNIKFDGVAPEREADAAAQWKSKLNIPPETRVLVAGSTHEGEEELLFQVLSSLTRSGTAPMLILAPRDPMRSAAIVASCGIFGLNAELMTAVLNRSPEVHLRPQVVVVDTIGVLKALYGLADVAFVGGSLVPCGGHNPLEPAIWGKPVLFGPDMRDFSLISRLLLEARAAQRVMNGDELLQAVKKLLEDPRSAAEMGLRGLEVIEVHQGSVDKTLKFLGLITYGDTVDQPWGEAAGPRC